MAKPNFGLLDDDKVQLDKGRARHSKLKPIYLIELSATDRRMRHPESSLCFPPNSLLPLDPLFRLRFYV